MLSWLANAWRVPELRRRLLFTAVVLALYRLGSFIPAPGVNSDQIRGYFSNQGGTVLGLLNLFSGNALSRFSVFALGIMPYITASIILQLMAVVVPTLAQLQKEGESGYAKINQYTRYLTIALAAAQAVGYSYLFRRQGILDANLGRLVLIVVTLTAGTTLLMWFGEQITKRGRRQRHLAADLRLDHRPLTARDPRLDRRRPDHEALLPGARPERDRRRRLHPGGPAAHPDPVREAHGRPADDRRRLHLPADAREHGRRDPDHLRRRGDGVPADDRAVLPADPAFINRNFTQTDWTYLTIEGVLIIVFTYFYTAVQFNPVDQADNLRKHGGYIPGIRPGPPTAQYLDRVLSRLTLPGSLYLAIIAVLPTFLIQFFNFSQATSTFLGGTSLLIIVGVALDTMRQMESQMMMRSYEGFLK